MRSSSLAAIASRKRVVNFSWNAAITCGMRGATVATRCSIEATRSSRRFFSFSPSRARDAELGVAVVADGFVERDGVRAEHAGPAQDVRGSEAGHAGPRRVQLFAQCAQLLQQPAVEVGRLRCVRQRSEADAALDLAALQARDNQLAQAGLERPQFLGQAELQIEIAVIDRAQLDVERRGCKLARCAGESGHAVDHGKGLVKSET